jgi:hypothetical protein
MRSSDEKIIGLTHRLFCLWKILTAKSYLFIYREDEKAIYLTNLRPFTVPEGSHIVGENLEVCNHRAVPFFTFDTLPNCGSSIRINKVNLETVEPPRQPNVRYFPAVPQTKQ